MACGSPCKNKLDFASLAKTRITIQKQTLVDDNIGGQTLTWTTILTVWAIVKPYSGREVFYSEQKQSRVTHKMTIRYNSLVSNTKVAGSYRITFADRIFNVQFVRNLDMDMQSEGKDYQELTVEENAQTLEG